MQRNRVFISYSHKDTRFLERLLVHLKPIEREGIVDIWSDQKIVAGADWRLEIENALQSASVAILLISADFLASSFIASNELPQLLKAAQQRGTRILPVILKACGYTRTPGLSKFQAVNDPSKPVLDMKQAGRERLWDKVASEVLGIVKKDESKTKASENRSGVVTLPPPNGTPKNSRESISGASKADEYLASIMGFPKGRRVYHDEYGAGVVTGVIQQEGQSRQLAVKFDDPAVGEQMIRWEYFSTLKVIEDENEGENEDTRGFRYVIGQRVYHQDYGAGVIISFGALDRDPEAVNILIHFDDLGVGYHRMSPYDKKLRAIDK